MSCKDCAALRAALEDIKDLTPSDDLGTAYEIAEHALKGDVV